MACYIASMERFDVDIADPDAILDYINKPAKWAPEYMAWVNTGQPQPDDAAWDGFCDLLQEILAS